MALTLPLSLRLITRNCVASSSASVSRRLINSSSAFLVSAGELEPGSLIEGQSQSSDERGISGLLCQRRSCGQASRQHSRHRKSFSDDHLARTSSRSANSVKTVHESPCELGFPAERRPPRTPLRYAASHRNSLYLESLGTVLKTGPPAVFLLPLGPSQST